MSSAWRPPRPVEFAAQDGRLVAGGVAGPAGPVHLSAEGRHLGLSRVAGTRGGAELGVEGRHLGLGGVARPGGGTEVGLERGRLRLGGFSPAAASAALARAGVLVGVGPPDGGGGLGCLRLEPGRRAQPASLPQEQGDQADDHHGQHGREGPGHQPAGRGAAGMSCRPSSVELPSSTRLGAAHEQVPCGLVEREGDDFAQVGLVLEDHEDPVEARGDPCVGRRP